MIRLEEVNEENWRLPLKVAESQAAYVPGPAVILARAYACRRSRSMAYVIYGGEGALSELRFCGDGPGWG